MDKPLLIKYELIESGVIYVFCEQTIAYVNMPDDDPEFITGVPADIVKKLLSEPGKVVSYKELYKACYGGTDPTGKYINHIQQQVGKLPEPLRQKKIKNYRVKKQSVDTNPQDKDGDNVKTKEYIPGYSLEVKKTTPIYRIIDNSIDSLPPKFYHLAGEYIALYPHHQKKNKLLGAFIQICKHDEGLAVNAIFDIPSNGALERVMDLISDRCDFSESINIIQTEIPTLNKMCWFIGTVKTKDDHIATLAMKSMLANDKRNIILDISDFLNHPDRELIEERDQYRGGLGLVVTGGRTNIGYASYRIGLIRKSWFNISTMGLTSKALLHHISATNVVNITTDLDSDFYLSILLNSKK